MILGIIVNLNKENVFKVLSTFLTKLRENDIKFFLPEELSIYSEEINFKVNKSCFVKEEKIFKASDLIISIGGDGTMLATAYKAQFYDKPVLGINFGKLGFLAEVNLDQIDLLITELKNDSLIFEKRMLLEGYVEGHNVKPLYAVNDLVIDKGGWPKMIELTIMVDDEYVSTFSADGLIISTPTGTTGYSLSTGGPIVNPKTDVITISPICPHILNMRSLILNGDQKIRIKANSLHKEIQVNCDGQRVVAFKPPLDILITQSGKSLQIAHTVFANYFETLRKKLMWGIDARSNNKKVKG